MSADKVHPGPALLAFLILLGCKAFPQAEVKPGDEGLPPPMEKLLDALQKNDFILGPPVEKTFLEAARRRFLDLLEREGRPPSPALRAWLGKHPDLARDLYLLFEPPDTRIAANLEELLAELGPQTCDEYANLVFGVSVGRREIGVGAVDLGPRGRIGEILPGKGKKPVRKKKGLPPQIRTRALQALSAFLKEKKWTPLEGYKKKDLTSAFLESRGLLPGGSPAAKQKFLQALLQEIFLREGKVPRRRDPFPSMAAYIRRLLEIQRVKVAPFTTGRRKKTITWPMFPLEAPWPLLMPLSQPIPLREQEYVWEKFQGKFGPKDRLHTYGPYVHGGRFEEKLVPSSWNYHSYPALIRIGGVCGTMSSIAKFAYVSLGVPALKCGQPGHSCLFRFAAAGKDRFFARLLQSVSSPYRTTTSWLLGECRTYRARKGRRGPAVHFEYYAGLALAMDREGTGNYIFSRALVNLFTALPAPEKKNIGPKILEEACRLCPFDVEPWYLLNSLSGFDLEKALALSSRLRSLALPGAPARGGSGGPKGRTSRRKGKTRPAGRPAGILQGAKKAYVDTVCLALLDKATAGKKTYSPEQWERILAGVRREKALNRYALDLSKLDFLCRIHVEGKEKALRALGKAFSALVSGGPRGKRARKRAVTRFIGEVESLRLALPPAESISLLESFLTSLPPRAAFNAPRKTDLPKVARDIEKGRFKPRQSLLFKGIQKAFLASLKALGRKKARKHRALLKREGRKKIEAEKQILLEEFRKKKAKQIPRAPGKGRTSPPSRTAAIR